MKKTFLSLAFVLFLFPKHGFSITRSFECHKNKDVPLLSPKLKDFKSEVYDEKHPDYKFGLGKESATLSEGVTVRLDHTGCEQMDPDEVSDYGVNLNLPKTIKVPKDLHDTKGWFPLILSLLTEAGLCEEQKPTASWCKKIDEEKVKAKLTKESGGVVVRLKMRKSKQGATELLIVRISIHDSIYIDVSNGVIGNGIGM